MNKAVNHRKKIMIKCWNCKKKFNIVTAKRCYEHLNYSSFLPDPDEIKHARWTTKCDYCGACVCDKIEEMENIDCKVLNNAGIMGVLPAVKRRLTPKKRN